jgi:hypothetical protein
VSTRTCWLPTSCSLGGKPYFVSDDAPIGVWTMANRMLACAGQGPVGRPIPAGLAYAVGAMMEGTYWLFGVEKEPLITRFGASELSYAQWFDIRREARPRVRTEGDDRRGLEAPRGLVEGLSCAPVQSVASRAG